jgi:hypothetical protein
LGLAEKKIKQSIGQAMASELRGRKHQDAREAAAGLARQLDTVGDAVAAGLDVQLATFREEVEAVLDAKRSGEAAAAARTAQLAQLAAQLDKLTDDLDDIVDEIAAI